MIQKREGKKKAIHYDWKIIKLGRINNDEAIHQRQ